MTVNSDVEGDSYGGSDNGGINGDRESYDSKVAMAVEG